MTKEIERRVSDLEATAGIDQSRGKPLPYIVADETSDAELEKMRAAGLEPQRFSEAIDWFAP